MAELELKIEGMTCQHCVMAVKKAVDGINGVSSSDVEVGSAKVTYDESASNKEAIVSVIQNAGYKVVE